MQYRPRSLAWVRRLAAHLLQGEMVPGWIMGSN